MALLKTCSEYMIDVATEVLEGRRLDPGGREARLTHEDKQIWRHTQALYSRRAFKVQKCP